MKEQVFDFQDYKRYLLALIESQPVKGRGFRSKLADAIGVQRAFVSQVLQKDLHFSLEQAEKLCRFIEMTPDESHYFLLLLQVGRAGTKELRKYFQDQLKAIQSQRLVLRNRLKNEKSLSLEDASRYYSNWYYQVIRCAVAIPRLRTRLALSRRLELSLQRVNSVVEFLLTHGLITAKGEELTPSVQHMHLPHDATISAKNHINWRMRAAASLDAEKAKDLHYSSVLVISEEDALAITSLLVNQIAEIKKRTEASPEEAIYSFCLDFFEI